MKEKTKLLELATQKQRFGYRRLLPSMKEAGFTMNHKKIYRLYKEAKLSLSTKKGKKKNVILERVPLAVSGLHACWSMDFVHDRLTDGKAFRCFGVIDNYSRLSIALEVASSFPALRVIAVLEAAIKEYGKPQALRMDNGPEFRSRLFCAWAKKQGIALLFIAPGRPVQNAYSESFNARLRDECLHQHWFSPMQEAKEVVTDWQEDYNTYRPHGSLGYVSPFTFIQKKRKEDEGRDHEYEACLKKVA